ncbi:MAG: response regulator [Oscillospiraceae bacterium]|nr:response regulator [Oscillospiraceae bacterium]
MKDAKKYSVLVVDDENTNIMALSHILSPKYDVYAAKNGQGAIRAAEKYLPDLILLDIIMPEMDGYAVLSALRGSERTKDIPVIFITGLSGASDEEKALSMGAADCIGKPFSPAVVKLRVENQLNMLGKLRAMEYDVINYKLASEAMKTALWDMEVVVDDPANLDNRFTWSREFRHMLGFSDEIEFPNVLRSWYDCLHPDDKERSVAEFYAHLTDYTGKTPYEIEYRLKNKNGEYRYYDGFGQTLRDSDGAPIRVSGYIRDITERKLVEAALDQQYHLLHAVNRAASVLLSSEGENKTFEESFRDGMEIIGQSLYADCIELWQNEMRGDALYAVRKHLWISEAGREMAPDSPVTEFSYDDSPNWESWLSQGEYIHGPVSKLSLEEQAFLRPFNIMTVLAIPIFIGNEFWGFCCIDDYFTSRLFSEDEINILRSVSYMLASAVNRHALADAINKAEIAEESNKAKSRFLATMSHEIRTPMNSIMGFAELALDMPDSAVAPRAKDYLGKIKDSTKWLLNIVNDILDISKIESGRMELEHAPFDLCEVFSRCQSVILPGVREKGLDLHVYATPLAGKKPVGDQVRLYQALMNLLSNAVKFTDAGSVNLSADVKMKGESAAAVRFEIKDSGIGMSSEQLEKVFAPFIQADSSTTRTYGGTGLGLTITKNIVELMGGELVVESSPGAGSTFSFEIVFDTVDASAALADTARDVLDKPYFDGLCLICDDNPMNRQVICEHLDHVGLKTVTAENGLECVGLVRARKDSGEAPFGLIFMDMFMPVMDGIEAASKIKELQTGTPIVAMTANIMASDLENYRRHGMPDYVGKPFTSQELWRVLLKYFNPIEPPPESSGRPAPDESALRKSLRLGFVKNNRGKYAEITEAIGAGDIKLAHRLAHTLKGNAGLIEQPGLQSAAAKVEAAIQGGALTVPEEDMQSLEAQLSQVLDELLPLLDEPEEKAQPLSGEQTLALFDTLGEMLENINPECVGLLSEVRAVPGTDELARMIEAYNFAGAARALDELRKEWSGANESGR